MLTERVEDMFRKCIGFICVLLASIALVSVMVGCGGGESEETSSVGDESSSSAASAVPEQQKTEDPKKAADEARSNSGKSSIFKSEATGAMTGQAVARADTGEAPAMAIDLNKSYKAVIVMADSFSIPGGGEIVVQLYAKEAPVTVNNFVHLARTGFYDGLTFHKVLPDQIAQGGDPTGSGGGGPGYKFDNELNPNLRHDEAGVLSMVNRGVVNGVGTNGSQFLITLSAQPQLDGFDADGNPKACDRRGVTCNPVFGKVVEGMDVVMKIRLRNPLGAFALGSVMTTIRIVEE